MNNEIFEKQSPARAYLKLSLPLVLSMVVTLIYNLTDTYFAAQTGSTAVVAGVSLCAPVFTFLMALGNIGGQGGSSLISRLMGQKKRDEARHVSAFCFHASLVTGIVIGIVMLVIRKPMVQLLGSDQDTMPHALGYYTWLSIGAPAVLLSFIHSNLLRAEGMAKESMIGTIMGALVNIVLDPIFISGLHMGAAGAAIASVIGYICSVVYDLIIVMCKSSVLSVRPADIPVQKEQVKDILSIGTPAALVNIMQSVSAILLNQSLLVYGSDKIAAMGIALKVNMIETLVLTGFAYGGQPLFGYYCGAQDRNRFHQLFHFCSVFIICMGIVLAGLEIVFAPSLVRVFMNTAEIVKDGAYMLRLQAVTMPLMRMITLIMIIFQAAGKAAAAFVPSLSRQGIVNVLVLFIAQKVLGYTGVIGSQAIADAISMAIAIGLAMQEHLI